MSKQKKVESFSRNLWSSFTNFARSTSSKQLERKITRLEEKIKNSEMIHDHRLNELPGEIQARQAEAKKAQLTGDKIKEAKLLAEVANLKSDLTKIPNLKVLAAKINPDLDQAWKALRCNKIQEGWGFYYEAELLYYRQLSPDASRAAATEFLHKRTAILNEGDKKSVQRLLGKTDDKGNWAVKPKSELKVEDVVKARKVIQKHYENKYLHLDMVQKQYIILGIVGVLVFICLIPVLLQVPDNDYTLKTFSANNFTATNVNATYINSTSITNLANFTATNFVANNVTAVKTSADIASGDLFFWSTIALFGALGGTVSGMISLKEAFKAKEDIPERILNGWVTIARPLVGLLISIAITVFLLSGLFTLLETAVTKYVIFAIAFTSGFTERFIVGVVQKQVPSEEKG